MDQCRVSAVWSYTKQYRAAIISAGLIYWGLALILSQLNYPVTPAVHQLDHENWISRSSSPQGDWKDSLAISRYAHGSRFDPGRFGNFCGPLG
jgi:hypothetical protein